jgi:hypothetical protein
VVVVMVVVLVVLVLVVVVLVLVLVLVLVVVVVVGCGGCSVKGKRFLKCPSNWSNCEPDMMLSLRRCSRTSRDPSYRNLLSVLITRGKFLFVRIPGTEKEILHSTLRD